MTKSNAPRAMTGAGLRHRSRLWRAVGLSTAGKPSVRVMAVTNLRHHPNPSSQSVRREACTRQRRYNGGGSRL